MKNIHRFKIVNWSARWRRATAVLNTRLRANRKRHRELLTLFIVFIPTVYGLPASTLTEKERPPLALGRHTVQVNGVQFAFYVAGTGPYIVVQAPGWGLGSQYLRQGLAPLERSFTLIFYDPRGSGFSGRPHDETTMTASTMVDDLEGLRKYWGLAQITLMGHSNGGSLALEYARRYRERVRRLILVDSGVLNFNPEDSMKREIAARQFDKRFEDAIAQFPRAMSHEGIETDEDLQSLLRHIWPLYFYDPEEYSLKFSNSNSELPSAWVFRRYRSDDIPEDELSKIRYVQAETLIVAGQNDWICGPETAKRINRAIQPSTLKIYERTGHFPWLEHASEFFDDVTRFAGK